MGYLMSDAIFNNLLTQNCSISRRVLNSSSIDKWGASSESFSVITASEDCLFQEIEELIEFSKKGEKFYSRVLVFFKFSANVLEDDIIEKDSKKFRVVGVEDAGGQGHHKEAYIINLEN